MARQGKTRYRQRTECLFNEWRDVITNYLVERYSAIISIELQKVNTKLTQTEGTQSSFNKREFKIKIIRGIFLIKRICLKSSNATLIPSSREMFLQLLLFNSKLKRTRKARSCVPYWIFLPFCWHRPQFVHINVKMNNKKMKWRSKITTT